MMKLPKDDMTSLTLLTTLTLRSAYRKPNKSHFYKNPVFVIVIAFSVGGLCSWPKMIYFVAYGKLVMVLVRSPQNIFQVDPSIACIACDPS